MPVYPIQANLDYAEAITLFRLLELDAALLEHARNAPGRMFRLGSMRLTYNLVPQRFTIRFGR